MTSYKLTSKYLLWLPNYTPFQLFVNLLTPCFIIITEDYYFNAMCSCVAVALSKNYWKSFIHAFLCCGYQMCSGNPFISNFIGVPHSTQEIIAFMIGKLCVISFWFESLKCRNYKIMKKVLSAEVFTLICSSIASFIL